MATLHRLTVTDLAGLPDDGRYYELLAGEVYQVNSPSEKHQRASIVGASWLYQADAAGFGYAYAAPFDVTLDEYNQVQPDLLFVAKERAHIIGEQGIQGAPDLIIEILSPATRQRDLTLKRQLYARAGVQYYWLVDPAAETVLCYELDGGGYRQSAELRGDDVLSSPLFPGLTLPVSRLFARR
jgi:Uma2 family endonuclease